MRRRCEGDAEDLGEACRGSSNIWMRDQSVSSFSGKGTLKKWPVLARQSCIQCMGGTSLMGRTGMIRRIDDEGKYKQNTGYCATW